MVGKTGLLQDGAYQTAKRLGGSSSTLAALGRYLGQLPRVEWAYYFLGIDKKVGYADHVGRLCSMSGPRWFEEFAVDWKSAQQGFDCRF